MRRAVSEALSLAVVVVDEFWRIPSGSPAPTERKKGYTVYVLIRSPTCSVPVRSTGPLIVSTGGDGIGAHRVLEGDAQRAVLDQLDTPVAWGMHMYATVHVYGAGRP